ncbi:gamma-butyrobetaine dioxygenase [Actinacidiphila yanglinensis]|uniref:Gamma-butyrobetaine dioxygenase n=1 Tax=Actinacidiphila yanglinensis TaxID=310779 RepID=A0A1H6E2T7_9ACTN|nr:TauD/TfdA family dioxygenase [Actinacidiphila yanglinensis]SEG91215.1 gamma-butyrobetaine dioxygenase [Actinacidiphila yanglinensis]
MTAQPAAEAAAPHLSARVAALPPDWLRDNCPCPDCRDPHSGQKLFQITDLPQGLAVGEVVEPSAAGEPSVEVRWVPDGHRSPFTVAWLDANQPADSALTGDRRTETGKELWAAADLAGRVPEAGWVDYLADGVQRARVLDAVQRLGFALLRGVPLQEGQVLAVAETFGHVRETNYGRLFDVRVEPDPNNLAFTSARITPHTDNPYRDPVPTLQLLHCLVNSATGGDSGLVDGFAAAAALRTEDPESFGVLTRTPVPFVFRDDRTELRADRPLIDVDPRGRIREVRFNNRSIGTLRLAPPALEAFYAAYRSFGELLLRPGLRLDLRLAPGDCLIFDNTRLLHARTAFEQDGFRHLQGAYADLDGLGSSLAVLRRADALDPLAELLNGPGAAEYLGEEVTMTEHMLQAGALAEAAGAPAHLVAAALLHDVGHFAGAPDEGAGDTDHRHGHTGADLLSRWFGPEVTEPVRLHVAAKRYLCTAEPGYREGLSEASEYTLRLQGGPMTEAEAAAFAALPQAADAVAVRRWDEQAKEPGAVTPEFGHFLPLLTGLLRG